MSFKLLKDMPGIKTGDICIRIFHPLAFKTAEARDFSFQHHEKYWKTYYQL